MNLGLMTLRLRFKYPIQVLLRHWFRHQTHYHHHDRGRDDTVARNLERIWIDLLDELPGEEGVNDGAMS